MSIELNECKHKCLHAYCVKYYLVFTIKLYELFERFVIIDSN